MQMKPLCIGEKELPYPIVQGGMGVGISLSRLAGAVAKEGGLGVISAAQPGFLEPDFYTHTLEANLRALKYHIRKAKELSDGGMIGVNIMRASRDYDAYVHCAVENGADIIISGAGLPIHLPELVSSSKVKFAPIVSSLKAVQVLFRMWERRYHTTADMVVIEGPKAGGHLGFTPEILASVTSESYEKEVLNILEYVKGYEKKFHKTIPVVFAGGVYDRQDILHYLNLGLDGVQMGTRFVATEECDASIQYKQAYVSAKKEDICIVKSPVGMPGRAIRNGFVKERETKKENVEKCFQCLDGCNPLYTPYCITAALIRAAKGDVDNALLFCGENAYRIQGITTVHALMEELTGKDKEMNREKATNYKY